MTHLSPKPFSMGKALAALALTASLAATSGAVAQFIPTGAGPYDYLDVLNWNGGTINNTFTASLTANQTVTFGTNTTLPTGTWTISNTTAFNYTFAGTGGDRTVTLDGSINLGNSATNANKVTIGSTTAGQALNIDLGASRNISVGTNRTLEFVNTISGAGSITKLGAGTMKLTGTANTFTGNIAIGGGSPSTFGGVLEVTKIANSGEASSIGTGNRITFGGSGGAATLRYVGTGDSSNRNFTVGSQGAIIDSAGTGAIQFTSASAISYGSSNNSPTITLTGTNTGDNSIAATIGNNGTGQPSISKTGTGKWILAGNSTYTGLTSVSAGTLLVNGSIASSGTTAVNGGVFGGTGSAGIIQVNAGGTLAPGASIQSFASADVTFNTNSAFAYEVDSSALAAVSADLQLANGGLSLNGTVTLTLTNLALAPASFATGTTLSLVNYTGSWNGGYFTYAGSLLEDGDQFSFNGQLWEIDYNASSGGVNFSGEYTSGSFVNMIAVVPEPSTTALIGVGFAAVLFRLRRRSA